MTGRLWVDGGVVRLERIVGRALEGNVTASGVLDFARSPSRVDLDLDLTKVDITETPKSWQLDETGITAV